MVPCTDTQISAKVSLIILPNTVTLAERVLDSEPVSTLCFMKYSLGGLKQVSIRLSVLPLLHANNLSPTHSDFLTANKS